MATPNPAHKKTAFAALTLTLPQGPGSSEIQLTPPGPTFRASDGSGRPADVAAWKIDAAIAARLAQAVAMRSEALVIDYEHQTLLADKNAQPAPAAGWFKALEWREGQGLFATGVKWNARASEMLKADEYRYISPVFEYGRPSGELISIRMAALTNNPGLTGMAAVALSALRSEDDLSLDGGKAVNETLKALLAALGLPDTTGEAAALTAVSALKAKVDEGETQLAALKAEVTTAQAAGKLDPSKYAPVEVVQSLQQQVAALSANMAASEADKLVAEAEEAGKLVTPELKRWAQDLGKTNLASLKSMLAAMAVTAALKGTQTGGVAPAAAATGKALTPEDQAVMKQLGLSSEEFLKGKV
ncbi:peptidase [Betaproteobacteria bacterium]|nr:peptidase [Betaproteobacteria bacterium]